MGAELCVDEAAVAMAVTEALKRRQEERRDGAVAAQVRGPVQTRPRRDRSRPQQRRGRGRDREPVRGRGGLEVAHERSKTRAEEVDGRRVRERLPTGAARCLSIRFW